jgi:hypothetical protein
MGKVYPAPVYEAMLELSEFSQLVIEGKDWIRSTRSAPTPVWLQDDKRVVVAYVAKVLFAASCCV